MDILSFFSLVSFKPLSHKYSREKNSTTCNWLG